MNAPTRPYRDLKIEKKMQMGGRIAFSVKVGDKIIKRSDLDLLKRAIDRELDENV